MHMELLQFHSLPIQSLRVYISQILKYITVKKKKISQKRTPIMH